MNAKRTFLPLLWLLPVAVAAAAPADPPQKVVQAAPCTAEMRIDGRLDEMPWQSPGYTDFTQNEPQDGAPPSEKTTVWVAFDRRNLYVAARLEDSQPQRIVRRLGRRDAAPESDWFTFAIDPYYDRRSGFLFAVNPAGSIRDATLSNDGWEDDSWDGVWESAAAVDGRGWTVEMRIPFDQLRFAKRDGYVWGLSFIRFISRKNEKCSFVWTPKGETGFVSRFARLEGVRGIEPGRRPELLPYTAAGAFFSPREPGNPFRTGSEARAQAGLDGKLALRSDLILDFTLNPDFGQVEVDPAEVNLSAFETYYSEKRPFFIEGSSLYGTFGSGGTNSTYGFNFGIPDVFYSRRIGRPPRGGVSGDGYADLPDATTILAAAKLSGRLGSWNLAALGALTAREYAILDQNGQRSRQEVEPFSGYATVRAQKEFNRGRQGLGFVATGVGRDLTGSLADLLPRRAFNGGIDGWLRLGGKQTWALTGWWVGSLVRGEAPAIERLQRSSLHYFQRPDAGHLELDPSATRLAGWGGRLALNKQRGNFMFNAALGALSPGLELNDMGYQWNADLVNGHVVAGYRWLKPGKVFRQGSIRIATYRSADFGGNPVGGGYFLFLNGTLRNYWGGSLTASLSPSAYSKSATRGGPLLRNPESWSANLLAWSDSRRSLELMMSGYVSANRAGGSSWMVQPSITWKPRDNVHLSAGPVYSRDRVCAQWVSNVSDPAMTATHGARYVFGRLDQNTLATDIRLSWVFTPRLSLQLYLQPYLAVGHYHEFKELARPSSFDFRVFGTGGSEIVRLDGRVTVDPDGPGPGPAFTLADPDFNLKSLRGTAVLRWEYRLGSTLYVVWTQDRADFAHPGHMRLWRDLGDLLTAPGNNAVMLKATYRFRL